MQSPASASPCPAQQNSPRNAITTRTETVTLERTSDEQVVLRLESPAVPDTRPRVQWTTDTVDNEHLGKKKSKCCCIYKKRRNWDESDTEDDFGVKISTAAHRIFREFANHCHHRNVRVSTVAATWRSTDATKEEIRALALLAMVGPQFPHDLAERVHWTNSDPASFNSVNSSQGISQ